MGAVQSEGYVPPISAATPVWSWPGKSGKPDSKLPIFSLRRRVGCLFYIFISTTECLPEPARMQRGGWPWCQCHFPAVPQCCKCPRLLGTLMGGCHWPHNPALLLGTVSSRLWPQLTQSLPKSNLQRSKVTAKQSAPLRTDRGTADWNKHKGSEEEVSLPPQTRWRMSRS